MKIIIKAVVLILALTALIVSTIIMANRPSSKMDEDLKKGVITKMKDSRMLTLAVKGDPDKTAAGAFSRLYKACLLYTSPSPRDGLLSRMPSSA